MMKFGRNALFAAAVAGVSVLMQPGVSRATLIVGDPQFNSGDVAPSPITASNNDLLQTSLLSVSGENASADVRNGTTGTAYENSVANPAVEWGQTTTTYTLDTSVNTLGYDITSINVFSGWTDARAGQSYSISYTVVGNSTFVPLGTVSDLAVNGSLLTSTHDSNGAVILTGVNAIQFTQIDQNEAGGVAVGDGTVFREFDLNGTPTTTPEPASLGLLGLAGLGLLGRRRRSE